MIAAMSRHSVVLALALAALASSVGPAAAQTPPPASEVVATALKRSADGQKAVLIEFGASWCVWCRNFEAFVKSPDAGPVLARYFTIVNLTVHERDDKKGLENPGGTALMDGWNGAKAGLPFYVFLNGAGEKVADSNAMPNGSNIGFPAVPDEIRAFVSLMQRAAPGLTASDRDVLSGYLLKAMPKPPSR